MKTNTLIDNPALSNLFGPLDDDIKARLRQVLADPAKYWNRDHGIVLREFLTLWQAIIRVDPTFPRVGRTTNSAGNVVRDWERYPDTVLIARAIKYASKKVGE